MFSSAQLSVLSHDIDSDLITVGPFNIVFGKAMAQHNVELCNGKHIARLNSR